MSFNTTVQVAHDPFGDRYVGRIGRVLYANGTQVVVAFGAETQSFSTADLQVVSS